jgi:hypothetical protein
LPAAPDERFLLSESPPLTSEDVEPKFIWVPSKVAQCFCEVSRPVFEDRPTYRRVSMWITEMFAR